MEIEKKSALEEAIKKEQSAVLVVNTYSRRGEQAFFAAMDELTKRGIKITASYPVRDPTRLPEVIKEAIERGNKLVNLEGSVT